MGAAGVPSGPKTYIEDVFSTWLYTGNGSTQTITNGIDLSGKGGLVWVKDRTGINNHQLVDTVRGGNRALESNTTDAQEIQGPSLGNSGIYSFFNAGFNVGFRNEVNTNSNAYASWTFREAEKFFDVVTYTGTGSNRTISHNLGSVPGCIIVKRTDATADWQVYHRSLGNAQYLVLNTTASTAAGSTRWNSTTPTSTVFSLGTDATVNASGGTYVAYLFAHNAGGFGDSGNDNVISCGSYTGNGSSVSVSLGWEPQFLLIKTSSTTGGWAMYDNMRGITTGNDQYLAANTSGTELSYDDVSLQPTGFTAISGGSGMVNVNGQTYIYIAIRRGPMKTPTDATKVFAPSISVGGFPSFAVGFPVDFNINGDRTGGDKMYAVSRLTGTGWMQTNTTAAEGTSVSFKWDSQTGCVSGWPPYIGWSFRRAPGFFDAVCYTGTGTSAQVVSHNLTVVPELFILKRRSSGTGQDMGWPVAVKQGSDGIYFIPGASSGLNTNGSGFVQPGYWALGFTSTTFTPGEATLSNPGGFTSGQTYIAYLFASCPGVSKVGSYTGTGTTLNIDCGFTAGARFVLIKRADSTGSWYVWDTARGIVSGNDPYLLLNSTAAEVTNTDYIDPLSSGFQISSTAPAEINANGGSFIYLAVA